MNTTSHRVYQTGEGERGSEVAANDLGRLRIRLLETVFGHLNEVTIAVVMQDCIVQEKLLGSVSKPGRRRQRERQQAKGLMSKAIAVHVRYKSLYIFFVL